MPAMNLDQGMHSERWHALALGISGMRAVTSRLRTGRRRAWTDSLVIVLPQVAVPLRRPAP